MGKSLQPIILCLGIFAFDIASGNQPPFVNFGPPSSNVFFPESTGIGTSLFKITAEDSDSSPLTFTMENEATTDLVELSQVTHTGDMWSVDVLLKAGLDRDRSPNTRKLSFKVSDGQSDIEGQVRLIIQDVNDNPPLFIDLPYRIYLEEGTSLVNKTVLKANVTDPDDGPAGSVIFSMVPQAQGADETYRKTFVILNEYLGDIQLAQELDYETRNYYQYQIFAKDRGTPQCPGPQCHCSNVTEPNVQCAGVPATFIVFVVDVQDTPPFFERLPYIAEVAENASEGTSFYQVSAQDGDRGVPNTVTYSIVDEAKFPFTMEAATGILRVGASGLDSDKPDGRSYILTVQASEVIVDGQQPGGVTSATTQVAITVHDINDNAPHFAKDVYHARVQENTPRGVPLTLNDTIEVSDKDQNGNGQFRLTVEQDGVTYDAFTTLPGPSVNVQSMTSVMVAVHNSSLLDYETVKTITFQLRATETSTSERYTNTTTVIVTIEDMNDNSPVFLPGQTTNVNVTEHATPGEVLATFTATDADHGDFGTVNYSLGEDLGKFHIDPQSGALSVMADIDREEVGGTGYSLVIEATDNMAGDQAQRRSSRLNIRVTVLDINDNAPQFQPHSPFVIVQENASPNTTLMTLTASDKDQGINSDIRYRVVSIQSPNYSSGQPQNLFDIGEKNGIIIVNAWLIGYPGSHNVTVMAFDSAAEPKNDSTIVSVYVQDVNINTPVFVMPNQSEVLTQLDSLPNITVPEEQPVGSLILMLNATDKDTGPNGLVFYRVLPGLNKQYTYFAVDRSTGRLTNDQLLDRETTSMFQITLEATDEGLPTPLSTKVEFRVILSDVNDNDPQFPPPATLTLSVGEEIINKQVGFVNIATDADLKTEFKIICYYLYGGTMAHAFNLVRETGVLRIGKELDRDVTPRVELLIKASADCQIPESYFIAPNGGSNVYNASDKSLLQLTVVVTDINDNPPVFDSKEALTVGLLYERPIGYEVINLVDFTTDEDTEENSHNYYELTGFTKTPSDPPERVDLPPFKVSLNGSVLTNRLFLADEDGVFVLTVKAFDSSGQTDTADITIYLVTDVQRVKLVINKRPNDVVKIKANLTRELEKALNLTIIVDKIATHVSTEGKADPNRTDVYLHARRDSGEIVPVTELWTAFDYNPKVRAIFQEYGVFETVPVLAQKYTDDESNLQKAFIIVALILAIICIVLIVVLINTVRRYRRRLRAATTSAFVSRHEETDSYVPPGTNKYYAAENPLFGKDMKPVFIDRLGNDNDSLDDNAVDTTKATSSTDNDNTSKGKEEEQEMYLELYDDDDRPGMHINHLAMVLQEYERDGPEGVEGSTPSSPPLSADKGGGGRREKGVSSAPNGHIKSDSGFNENGGFENGGFEPDGPGEGGLDNLQHTDI